MLSVCCQYLFQLLEIFFCTRPKVTFVKDQRPFLQVAFVPVKIIVKRETFKSSYNINLILGHDINACSLNLVNLSLVNASTHKKCVFNEWQLLKELFIIRSAAQKEVLNRIRYGFNFFCDCQGIVKQDGNVLWFQLLCSLDAAVLSGVCVTSFSCIWKQQSQFVHILTLTTNVRVHLGTLLHDFNTDSFDVVHGSAD